MVEIKLNENNLDKELLKTLTDSLIGSSYDAHGDLRRAKHDLNGLLSAKGPQTFFKITPNKEREGVDSWYNNRIGEIASEQQRYVQRVEEARNSGAIDSRDADKLLMGLSSSSTNPFQRARQEASEIYNEKRKF